MVLTYDDSMSTVGVKFLGLLQCENGQSLSAALYIISPCDYKIVLLIYSHIILLLPLAYLKFYFSNVMNAPSLEYAK